MENEIIWIKEEGTNNIYCCELVKAHLICSDIVYDINCIIGSFESIIIPRYRTFKNPVPCMIFRVFKFIKDGNEFVYPRGSSTGMACYDIEKL